MALSTRNDSASTLWISNSGGTWTGRTEGWAHQPMRRIYHSSSFWNGNVIITGGERADGSNLGFQDPYIFDPYPFDFTSLTTQNGPPDLVGHSAVILPNGTMVIVGGYSNSATQMQAMNTIYTYDLNQNTWSSFTTEGDTAPEPRRNFAAVLIGQDAVLIHGGTDSDLQTARSNGFILNLSTRQWTALTALETNLGARWDHTAVSVANLVFFLFGNCFFYNSRELFANIYL